MSDIVYSTNGKDFHDFDHVMDNLMEVGFVAGDKAEIYKGESVPAKHSDFIDVDHILEDMRECAYDDHDEYADGYLEEITDEDSKELTELIAEFLFEKIKNPTFYAVKNIKKIEITIE